MFGTHPARRYQANGSLQHNKLRALARPYAASIAGPPTHMSFSRVNRTFSLAFAWPATIPRLPGGEQAPTVVVVAAVAYPQGYTVALTPAMSSSWRATDNSILILLNESWGAQSSIVTVIVSPL